MVGETPHRSYGSSSHMPEELSLLHHKVRGSPEGGGWCQRWKQRLLGSLVRRCVVCLQVQHVTGMPPSAEGHSVVVGWKSKGSGGEHTAPARVSGGGAAAFDEVFLHYFSVGGASLRSLTVWAALVVDSASGPGEGGGGGDLGVFPVDVHTFTGKNHGGGALSFPLRGAAAGAVLTVSVDCRLMGRGEIHGANANGHVRERKNKGKRSSYASCLLGMSCLRNQLQAPALTSAGSARPATSLRFDRVGFITMENSMAEMDGGDTVGLEEDEDEDAGFITMENDTFAFGSRRALLTETLAGDDNDVTGMPEEDEKTCLFMEPSWDGAAEKVEDEFLAMLEDNYWTDNSAHMAKGKEIDKDHHSVSVHNALDDLDSLVKDAETERARAEQSWKSKVSAAIVEEQEYKEVVKKWSTRDVIAPSYNSSY